MNKGWIKEDYVKSTRAEILKECRECLKAADVKQKPPIEYMFTDVYEGTNPTLEEQKKHLHNHLKKYGKHYKLEKYMGDF